MKKLLCYVIVLIFSYSITNAQRVAAGDDWRISEEDAKGMMGRLKECGVFKPCKDNSKVVDPQNEVYKWIVATYSATCNISTFEGRYRDQDEERYKRLRGLGNSEKAKVKGYKTLIVKVEPMRQKGAGSGTLYFDCYTICPPPSDCSSIPVPNND